MDRQEWTGHTGQVSTMCSWFSKMCPRRVLGEVLACSTNSCLLWQGAAAAGPDGCRRLNSARGGQHPGGEDAVDHGGGNDRSGGLARFGVAPAAGSRGVSQVSPHRWMASTQQALHIGPSRYSTPRHCTRRELRAHWIVPQAGSQGSSRPAASPGHALCWAPCICGHLRQALAARNQ